MGAELLLVGKKGGQYFGRRTDQYEVVRAFETGQKPTVKESQAIADVIYSKFVSLISSDPIVQTLLPMTPEGEVCDIEGNCIDAADDELFKLTTKEGELAVERETTSLDAEADGF